jgi:hypothetical protein
MRKNEGISENSSGQQLPDQPAKEDMRAVFFRCLLLLLTVFATACGALPKGPGMEAREHTLFLQAMDETAAATPGTALVTLQRDYPDSPWTARARALTEADKARKALEVKVQTLQQEKNRLLQENSKLKEDLEKLKKLGIETERRRK